LNGVRSPDDITGTPFSEQIRARDRGRGHVPREDQCGRDRGPDPDHVPTVDLSHDREQDRDHEADPDPDQSRDHRFDVHLGLSRGHGHDHDHDPGPGPDRGVESVIELTEGESNRMGSGNGAEIVNREDRRGRAHRNRARNRRGVLSTADCHEINGEGNDTIRDGDDDRRLDPDPDPELLRLDHHQPHRHMVDQGALVKAVNATNPRGPERTTNLNPSKRRME